MLFRVSIRPLTHAQAGDNKEVDTKLKEQLAKERAKAALQARKNKKRPAEDSDAASAVAQLVAAESSKVASPAAASEDGEVADSTGPPAKKSRAKGPKGQKGRKKNEKSSK